MSSFRKIVIDIFYGLFVQQIKSDFRFADTISGISRIEKYINFPLLGFVKNYGNYSAKIIDWQLFFT